MKQLVQPSLDSVGRIGYCLEYASRLVFRNPAFGTTAWAAWEVAKFKHEDQDFPSDVAFPVWFSGAGGAGHVAVYTPQGIYSSPYNASTGHNVLRSIAEVERLYGVKYVGWSEDVLNLRVVKGEDMVTIDLTTGRIFYFFILGRNGQLGKPNALNGDCDDEIKKFQVGSPLTNEAIEAIYQSPECQHYAQVEQPSVYAGSGNAIKLTKGNYYVE